MPLSLPFFKFYVTDWLTSEKIALMQPQHIGAYIMLLAQCWTQEHCTLPSDPVVLKKMSKWDDTQHGDFTPVLQCFVQAKQHPTRLVNARLLEEWTKAKQRNEVWSESGQRGAQKRWAKKPASKVPRTPPISTTTDWLNLLKSKPIYAHINWDREMGKIDEWHSRPENKHRIINQRFVANWVNKIEPPLTNGQIMNGTLACPVHPHMTFADRKTFDTHNFLHHPKYEG